MWVIARLRHLQLPTSFRVGSMPWRLTPQGQSFCVKPGRAPGREEGELAVGDGAPDQQAARPQAGKAVVVLGGLEVGQLQVGPAVEPRALGALAGRETCP